jgi:GH15 family glucan-1,4-alpha-glucosidase
MVEAARLVPGTLVDADDLLVTRVRAPGMVDYLPIAEHGLIGDQRSAALVGTDGTIDWYCPDRFDAPAVFAAILDRGRGGYYRIASTDRNASTKQLYLPDTNVLVTRFLSQEGVAELHDFMPLDSEHQQLVRRVVGIRGRVPFRAELEPRFDYAREQHLVRRTRTGVLFTGRRTTLSLAAPVPLAAGKTGATAEFSIGAGESVWFVLCSNGDPTPLDDPAGERLLWRTIAGWREWLARSTYAGRWRERVHRSALTLALLTYAPTGAMVAAPTTSLPELLGGSRNWDYRYVWARDFAFCQYALSKLGFTEEARRVNGFTRTVPFGRAGDRSTPLSPLFRVDGSHGVSEQVLDHLEGYRGARPVRIGNGASHQLQLDLYGEILDAIYVYEQLARDGRGQFLSYEGWQEIALHVDWLCTQWDQPRRRDLGSSRRPAELHVLASHVLGRLRSIDPDRDQPWTPGQRRTLDCRARRHVRMDHGPRLERDATRLRATRRHRRARRIAAPHAPRAVRGTDRSALAVHARRDQRGART